MARTRSGKFRGEVGVFAGVGGEIEKLRLRGIAQLGVRLLVPAGAFLEAISFQLPSIRAKAPACSTRVWRAAGDLPSSAGSTFRLSRADGGAGAPASAAKVASRSTWLISAPERESGAMRPGQRAIRGRACRHRSCCTCRREADRPACDRRASRLPDRDSRHRRQGRCRSRTGRSCPGPGRACPTQQEFHRRTNPIRGWRRRADPCRTCRRNGRAAGAGHGCRGWRSRGRTGRLRARSINAVAFATSVSAIDSSVQRADFPPVI